MRDPACLSVLVIAFGLGFGGSADAQYYKCRDDSGATVFSQTPCGPQSEKGSFSAGTQSVDAELCADARLFAVGLAENMRRGVPAPAAMDEHGGVDGASKPALNVINYVYSFEHDPDTNASRIGALTQAKCSNGGFGRLSQGDLPQREADEAQAAPAQAAPSEPQADRARPAESPRPPQASTPTTADASVARDCERYREKIQQIEDAMRAGYSSAEGERLRRQRRLYAELAYSSCP